MKSYKYTDRINYKTIFHDLTSSTEQYKHCLEEIKHDYLKKKTVILENKHPRSIDFIYPKEIRDRWINTLQKELKLKFSYSETTDAHYITLNYVDFHTINELYIIMLLVRYLWYAENNMLIYRIFDILDKSSLSFDESLYLAHMYDNVFRDKTFNLFTNSIVPFKTRLISFIGTVSYDKNIQDRTFQVYGSEDVKIHILFTNFLNAKKLSENYNEEYSKLERFCNSKLYYISSTELSKIQGILEYFNYPYDSIELTTFNDCKIGDKVISLSNTCGIYELKEFNSEDYSTTIDLINNKEKVVLNNAFKNYKIYKLR